MGSAGKNAHSSHTETCGKLRLGGILSHPEDGDSLSPRGSLLLFTPSILKSLGSEPL